MVIYSFKYISAFFILFWIYWFFCKSKSIQNFLLLIVSYVFYGLWDWRFVPLLLATSLVAYYAGIYIKYNLDSDKTFMHKTLRWWICCGAVVFSLGVLGYFKYVNFFILSINDLFGREYFEPLHVLLPVGISFFTFSSISYIVDCYQRKLEPTTDLIAGLLYTSFFPALLSGPIHKATEQMPQYLKKREFDYDLVTQGFKDYLWGAFMKLCVADRLGMYVDAVYGNIPNHSGTTLLLTSVAYTFQIYSDFAGYSLMAIGCGKMLGIKLQINFNLPYFAKTITEFWSKWHMSLTGWFKSYVYIPLGGNRVGKIRWIFNIMVVFLLSGLWHGAAYTFIIWGAIHGVAQVIEKLIYGTSIKKISDSLTIANVFRVLLTFTIVNFAWIFFRLTNINEVLTVILKIFSSQGKLFIEPTLFLAIGSLSILLIRDIVNKIGIKIFLFNSHYAFVRYFSVAFVIAYILLFGVLEGGQFIYFQF